MRRYIGSALLIAILAPLTSCWDDADDVAFVQKVVPTLLGRKPKGSAEIDVLVELIAEVDDNGGNGREAVVDLLMNEPEFQDYWMLVLADALHTRRIGGAGGLQQPEACWDAELAVTTNGQARDLAEHIADPTAPDSYTPRWNMHDALRAAVVGDDLAVAWLAYLPALVSAQQSSDDVAETTLQFTQTYMGRSADCLACHSSAYSTVNAGSGWDRHFTSPWSLETSVWRSNTVMLQNGSTFKDKYLGGLATYTAVGSCSGCHDENTPGDGARDVTDVDPDSKKIRLRDRVALLSDDELEKQMAEGGGEMAAHPVANPAQVVAFLRVSFGATKDTNDFLRFGTHTGGTVFPRGISETCSDAIDIAEDFDADTSRPRVFAGQPTLSPDVNDLAARLRSGLGDLRGALDAADEEVPGSLNLPMLDADVAFAYFVAETVADELADEISGERLSVSHGFSRNAEQAQARHDAVDALVVTEDGRTRLSLENLLRETVLAPTFNQRSPESTSESAWPFPMIFNPWVATDPRESAAPVEGADANGVGDTVHRYSPNNALTSVSHSLGWLAPEIFAGPDFPGSGFTEDIGGFRSDDVPGFDEWDMQSLLHWEAKIGDCEQTEGGATDWIDDLMAAAAVASPTPTVLDVVESTRDRLLGSPDFEPGELAAIEVMSGVPANSLASTPFPLGVTYQNAVEVRLRKYCGALLVSPQYTMAGLPLPEASGPPALVVCRSAQGGLPAETCTAAALETRYRDRMPAPHDDFLTP